MKKEDEEEILKVFGAKSTKEILEYLDQHDAAPYMEMAEFANVGTLNLRLIELIRFKLVSHHLERKPNRIEWYEITEKGRQVLKQLEILIELTAESS